MCAIISALKEALFNLFGGKSIAYYSNFHHAISRIVHYVQCTIMEIGNNIMDLDADIKMYFLETDISGLEIKLKTFIFVFKNIKNICNKNKTVSYFTNI